MNTAKKSGKTSAKKSTFSPKVITDDDIDRGLMPGLHHHDWKDKGESADKTRYPVGVLKQNEKKNFHKLLVK